MSIRLVISTSINLNIFNNGYTYILNFIIIYDYFIILYQIRTRSKDEITKLSEALATLTPSKFSDNDLSGYKVLYYFRAAVS